MIGLLPRTRIFVDEATLKEAEALAELHADGFVIGWSSDDIAALMAGDNLVALAVRRESLFGLRKIVGFVMVRIAADEAEILTIAVSRSRRGNGFGRLLMEEALRRLYRERVATCFLEVNHDNRPAVALYRSLGFEEVGTRKGYYDSLAASGAGGSALVMRLQLR